MPWATRVAWCPAYAYPWEPVAPAPHSCAFAWAESLTGPVSAAAEAMRARRESVRKRRMQDRSAPRASLGHPSFQRSPHPERAAIRARVPRLARPKGRSAPSNDQELQTFLNDWTSTISDGMSSTTTSPRPSKATRHVPLWRRALPWVGAALLLAGAIAALAVFVGNTASSPKETFSNEPAVDVTKPQKSIAVPPEVKAI